MTEWGVTPLNEKDNTESSSEGVIDRVKKLSELSSEELVELFLTLANIKHTPETARALLDRFGSPERVLAAPAAALEKVDGMGFDSAVRISLIYRTVVRAMSQNNASEGKRRGVTPEAILSGRISGLSSEAFAYVFEDGKNELSSAFTVSGEMSAQISVAASEIIENAAYFEAKKLYIAHNHPSGGGVSSRDIESTKVLRKQLAAFSLELAEHFVFSRSAEGVGAVYRVIRDFIV